MVLAACAPKVTTTPGATEVVPTGPASPYIGSGQLDGNGIPPTFFSDLNIRLAFAHSFNWATYIRDAFKGEAVQSSQLALPGMPGYDPNQAVYVFDKAKAEEYFKASTLTSADGASLWDTGFRYQMLYNTGNLSRQTVAQIIASTVYSINTKFVVEVLGLPWPAYLAAQRAGYVPMMPGGWQEDIHDPHNWYQPYTFGSYGGKRQGLPADLLAQFKTIMDAGVAETDPAARTEIYKGFNQLYYEQAVGVPLVIATSHGFQQKWVTGRVMNPLYSGLVFAPIAKAATAVNPTAFTYETIGDIDTMDPALAYDTSSGQILQNVYDTLVFFDGDKTDAYVPAIATEVPTVANGGVSADGLTYTFKIRQGVTFHNGDVLKASDVAYSFARGLLQGGGISPQFLLTEPFFGVGTYDVAELVDPATVDDPEALKAADPAKLTSVCETVLSKFVVDDAAGTVTMTLANPWGPFLATIAQTWGSILDQAWVVANGGWDGTCATWQNFYAMQSADDPISKIANGTGPYELDVYDPGISYSLKKFATYWGTPAILDRVVVKVVPEWGTRFADLQTGNADIVDVPSANRPQVDAMVGEIQIWDAAANAYGATQLVCGYDNTKQAAAQFTLCAAGETPATDKPFHLFIGRPGISMDVLLFNWNIQ